MPRVSGDDIPGTHPPDRDSGNVETTGACAIPRPCRRLALPRTAAVRGGLRASEARSRMPRVAGDLPRTHPSARPLARPPAHSPARDSGSVEATGGCASPCPWRRLAHPLNSCCSRRDPGRPRPIRGCPGLPVVAGACRWRTRARPPRGSNVVQSVNSCLRLCVPLCVPCPSKHCGLAAPVAHILQISEGLLTFQERAR